MPTPTLVIGAPCWIDLYSSDTEKATEFYGGLFGWTTEMQGEEFGGYFTFLKDGKHVGGCMANSGEEGKPDMWTVYLTTDDVQRTAKDAAAKGGQVHMEPMQVAENGSFAIMGDPGGAGIGAWQADKVSGFDIWNEPGARGGSSYTRGTTTQASTSTGKCSAGTSTRTATSPTSATRRCARRGRPRRNHGRDAVHARGSARVLDDLLRRRGHGRRSRAGRELGGKVVTPAKDTPWGRLAEAADPTGTSFKLMASSGD